MKYTRFFYALFLSGLMLVIMQSCKKSTDPVIDESTQSSSDNALAEGEFSSIFNFVNSQGDYSTNAAFRKGANEIQSPITKKSDQLPDCATVNYDSVAHTILIDFGSTNCVCKDGFSRRGKIHISWTGKWKQIGSSITATLEDYYVEDMRVTGTKTITVLSPHSFNISVSGASITTPNGVISWNSTRTFTQSAGTATPLIVLDDEWTINGSGSGTNRQGVNFTVAINEAHPLVHRVLCTKKDFISGILTIQNDRGNTLSVNYDPFGTYLCDKIAQVTINGKTYTITLR